MSDDERVIMQQHAAYTKDHFKAGNVLLDGPVLAAAGSYGAGVLEVGVGNSESVPTLANAKSSNLSW